MSADTQSETAPSRRQLWVLLTGDPATGLATRPVGVLGVEGDVHHVTWLPLEPAAEPWRERLAARADAPLARRLVFWAERANATIDLAPLEPPTAATLRDAAEIALDELLAAGAGE